MHREPLLAMLDCYRTLYPGEAAVVDRVRTLVTTRSDCLLRTCHEPGHLTGAAWIVSPDRRRCLLTHHRKLDRWLQLGGHADGDGHLERVALREAREESGMSRFELLLVGGAVVPFDLDVHTIPPHGDEPAHEHHDVRFLLIAAPGQEIVVSDESHDVRWFDVDRLGEVTDEDSVLRMARKSRVRHPSVDD